MWLNHLTINKPICVTFSWADTELLDFKPWKIGQNLHANMEGFRRDNHIYYGQYLKVNTGKMLYKYWPVYALYLHCRETTSLSTVQKRSQYLHSIFPVKASVRLFVKMQFGKPFIIFLSFLLLSIIVLNDKSVVIFKFYNISIHVQCNYMTNHLYGYIVYICVTTVEWK